MNFIVFFDNVSSKDIPRAMYVYHITMLQKQNYSVVNRVAKGRKNFGTFHGKLSSGIWDFFFLCAKVRL